MGINSLLPFLKPAQRPIHIRSLAGKTVAVDAYVWLHKGAISCAVELASGTHTTKYVEYCMYHVKMLLHHGVKPYMVFDGGPLPSKQGTEIDRKRSREENRAKGLEHLARGDTANAREFFKRAIDVTPAMAYQVIKELQDLGVPYVVAPYEADAQLAYLDKIGAVDAIITEDSDLLAFGCKRVIFKLDRDGSGIEICQSRLSQVGALVGWTHADFLKMCILSGCDYLPSVHGVGLVKAAKYLRRYKTVEKTLRGLRMDGLKVKPDYLLLFAQAESTFLYQRVYDPEQKKLVTLNPVPGELDVTAMPFIGPHVSDALAEGIACGQIDPSTLEPIKDLSIIKSQPVEVKKQANTLHSYFSQKDQTIQVTSSSGHSKLEVANSNIRISVNFDIKENINPVVEQVRYFTKAEEHQTGSIGLDESTRSQYSQHTEQYKSDVETSPFSVNATPSNTPIIPTSVFRQSEKQMIGTFMSTGKRSQFFERDVSEERATATSSTDVNVEQELEKTSSLLIDNSSTPSRELSPSDSIFSQKDTDSPRTNANSNVRTKLREILGDTQQEQNTKVRVLEGLRERYAYKTLVGSENDEIHQDTTERAIRGFKKQHSFAGREGALMHIPGLPNYGFNASVPARPIALYRTLSGSFPPAVSSSANLPGRSQSSRLPTTALLGSSIGKISENSTSRVSFTTCPSSLPIRKSMSGRGPGGGLSKPASAKGTGRGKQEGGIEKFLQKFRYKNE